MRVGDGSLEICWAGFSFCFDYVNLLYIIIDIRNRNPDNNVVITDAQVLPVNPHPAIPAKPVPDSFSARPENLAIEFQFVLLIRSHRVY